MPSPGISIIKPLGPVMFAIKWSDAYPAQTLNINSIDVNKAAAAKKCLPILMRLSL